MYGFYTPLILLHAYCIYHAYRNNATPRWYWLILLLPVIGCVMYLIHILMGRSAISIPGETSVEAAVSNYHIGQLENAVEFNDSISNKEALADAYVDAGRYTDAIPLYQSCLQGFMADDPPISMKLLYAYFMIDNYQEAIKLGDVLEGSRVFRNSDERLAYAWALYYEKDIERSHVVFADMDRAFTNYLQRFEYCKFLLETGKPDAAKEKLSELLQEFEQMKDTERRQKRSIQRDIKTLHETLVSPA